MIIVLSFKTPYPLPKLFVLSQIRRLEILSDSI